VVIEALIVKIAIVVVFLEQRWKRKNFVISDVM
jgi:hypothetical protein